MNKFKLFLILILSTVLCIPKADAIVNMDGSIFTQAPQLNFYDNTRGVLTSVGSGYDDTYGFWVSNNSLITTGANTDGVNVTFTANEGFVAGYTYSLSILIATENSRAKPSSTRICTAENITNANIRFQQGYPCTNAISITSMDGVANFDFGDVSWPYTILTYVFTPDFTSPTITLTYNTVSGNNSRHLFGGYSLTVLSDNRNGISSNEVQSIINNSGLASANSVQELQTEIENVKQDINNASDAIVDSNKETQDVIKEQTKDQIESQKVCRFIDKNNIIHDNQALGADGSTYSNSTTGVTDYIKIIGSKIISKEVGGFGFRLVFYDTNKNYLSSIFNNDLIQEQEITIPNNAEFIRFTIYKPSNKPQFEICTNGNQALNDSVNDLNQNITSSDTSSSEGQAGSFFENFNTTDNGGISSIVTAPLVAIDKMLSGTCSPLTATYKNKNISLPCGDNFWTDMPEIQNFLNIVLGGFLCYGILSKLYLLIDRLKNPEDDRVDVMKL